VHCFTYIGSAVEAPRAQWQGTRREHPPRRTRPTSNAANSPRRFNPLGRDNFGLMLRRSVVTSAAADASPSLLA
jgi:hypothetical protein